MDTRSDRPDGGTEVILFPSKEVKNDRLLVFPSPGFTEAPKSPIAVLGDESGQTRIVSARLENSQPTGPRSLSAPGCLPNSRHATTTSPKAMPWRPMSR